EATTQIVHAIEQVAGLGRARPAGAPILSSSGQRLLRWLMAWLDAPDSTSLLLSPHEAEDLRERERRLEADRLGRINTLEKRATAKDERIRAKQDVLRERRRVRDGDRLVEKEQRARKKAEWLREKRRLKDLQRLANKS
ncbi:MAG: hypothetical protein NTY02_19060, partial [Acidobacteria bacterium]|nr:hypothetical protein [Acidobacteriota bacterium]